MDDPAKPRVRNRSKLLDSDRAELKKFLFQLADQGITGYDAQQQAVKQFRYTSTVIGDFYHKEVQPTLSWREREREAAERFRDSEPAPQPRSRKGIIIASAVALVIIAVIGPDILMVMRNSGGGSSTVESTTGQSSPSTKYAECKAILQPTLESCLSGPDESAWAGCKQIFMDAMADCTKQPR
ncbi:hypothetical protein GR702_11675 [Novosphingobium sp. FGD1]|uniref:Uncharacterized protein n=1 Tax=Novosphingobium silvae TaxID=2692619 RepID=A0A7X4K8K9_9SPHN|nr:hypothetical protein [Novosphingobium silvae]MYL98423.1 hypothetical protein [Novosphingobium silvae]